MEGNIPLSSPFNCSLHNGDTNTHTHDNRICEIGRRERQAGLPDLVLSNKAKLLEKQREAELPGIDEYNQAVGEREREAGVPDMVSMNITKLLEKERVR